MNKLTGFITIEFGENSIPVKFSSFAIDSFLSVFGLTDLLDIKTLYGTITLGEGEDAKEFPRLKEPRKFAAAMLWAGADYVSRHEGGKGYRLIEAYEWVDHLGGVDSEKMLEVTNIFLKSMTNGGSPPSESDNKSDTKKKRSR